MADCLFCKILAKELPSRVVLEDEQCVVIEDKFPQAPVHVLVIPRKHYDSLREMGEAERDLLGHCLLVSNRAAKAKGIDVGGYSWVRHAGVMLSLYQAAL